MSAAPPELAAFVVDPLIAVVGTTSRDGTVVLNPVWFEYRDDCFWLTSYESAVWPKRIRCTGASVLVIDPKGHSAYDSRGVRAGQRPAQRRENTLTRCQSAISAIPTVVRTSTG